MKYKVDEEVVFHSPGHKYDGCICTIDSIDNYLNLYVLHIDNIRIVAKESLVSEKPVPFELGDVITTRTGAVLLYCRPISNNRIVGNVIDARGVAYTIDLRGAVKANKDDAKKFFQQLKNSNSVIFRHLTDRAIMDYNHHIKKILQILDYEID